MPSCLRLLLQWTMRACSLARLMAGSSIAISRVMMDMTTSNSISVNPKPLRQTWNRPLLHDLICFPMHRFNLFLHNAIFSISKPFEKSSNVATVMSRKIVRYKDLPTPETSPDLIREGRDHERNAKGQGRWPRGDTRQSRSSESLVKRRWNWPGG